jgi:cell division protein FtsX
VTEDTARSIPRFFLGIGFVCLVAATVGGHLVLGLVMLGVMAACSLALILLRRRSETYRGLTEELDERFAKISRNAWAGTGVVLTIGNLGAFIGDLASGRSGDPYYWLLATAAISYIVLVAILRRLT